MKIRKSGAGFTLVELLVAISIIAVLSTVGFTTYSGIQTKARDSIRKNDLTKLATALELYFQKPDNGKYMDGTPAVDGNCASEDTNTFYTGIAPLMSDNIVPTDPKTQARYCYISVNNGQSFRLFAKLENCADSDNPLCASADYNYSIVSDNITLAYAPGDPAAPTPTPAPTQAPTPAPTLPPYIVVNDLFNRTNNSSLLGNADTGQPWNIIRGSWGISNNTAYPDNGCPAPGYAVINSNLSDGTIQVTAVVNPQDTRIPFRVIDENNLYWVERIGGNQYSLRKRVGGIQIELIRSSNIIPADGDVIKITLSGPNITVYINGALAMAVIDNSLSSAKHGIGVWCSGAVRFDNFSVSNIIAPDPGATPIPSTIYTLYSDYSGTQGPVWYYYYYNAGFTQQARYGANPWITWDTSPAWYAPNSYMAIRRSYIVAGDSQRALIFWKAPSRGSANITITQQKQGWTSGQGNGYKFGLSYSFAVGSWPATLMQEVTVASNDTSAKTITAQRQMQGNDALVYHLDSINTTYRDDADYTISITFTPN